MQHFIQTENGFLPRLRHTSSIILSIVRNKLLTSNQANGFQNLGHEPVKRTPLPCQIHEFQIKRQASRYTYFYHSNPCKQKLSGKTSCLERLLSFDIKGDCSRQFSVYMYSLALGQVNWSKIGYSPTFTKKTHFIPEAHRHEHGCSSADARRLLIIYRGQYMYSTSLMTLEPYVQRQ